jgi:hypothetical protein
MRPASLVLYSRRGCCLCAGLEERLRALVPAPALQVLDIDADPVLLARYDQDVPVLALRTGDDSLCELPRVSPRLGGQGLADWLQRNGFPGQSA